MKKVAVLEKTTRILDYLERKLLSERTKRRSDDIIVAVAIISFLLHLLVILLNELEILNISNETGLFSSPIAAIYTPFSFILLYEVYLLVYYLPKSISLYISKQYEIITLVIIRRIFKDLANLDLNANWFENAMDLQLIYDLSTTLILFALILLFQNLNRKRIKAKGEQSALSTSLKVLIKRKKMLALVLVPIFMILAVYSLGDWLLQSFVVSSKITGPYVNLNDIFFNEFFTVLILADVLLLLLSLFHTDRFSKVMRNSGFIISTILIRISFGTAGLPNNLLIITAVIFGVLILLIQNQYEKIERQTAL